MAGEAGGVFVPGVAEVSLGLLPRLGGSSAEAQAFCLAVGEGLPESERLELLARSVQRAIHFGCLQDAFDDGSYTWPEVHAAFAALLARWPGSVVNINGLAFAAWAAGDVHRAKAYTDALQGDWDPDVWAGEDDWRSLPVRIAELHAAALEKGMTIKPLN
jgi:hypothetical protein